MKRFFAIVALSLTALVSAPANAGSSAAGDPILPVADVAAFSNRVQQDLAARGAQVAIVARVGRDPALLPEGINYTHIAFWVYSRITRADGSTGMGYQAYNLYQRHGDLTRSDLVRDMPEDFFAGAHVLDAGVIIPDPRLQQKLLEVITSPAYAALHNPAYAVLSNPATSMFQNCTEHTLDVVMAALYGTSDVAQIKANIGAYFIPQPVRLNAVQRLFAPAASQALTTVDHGPQVATATFGSIARFMQSNDLAAAVYRITPDRVAQF